MRRCLFASLLLGCTSPLAPEEAIRIAPNVVTDSAVVLTTTCAGPLRPVLRPYLSLVLYVVPGETFDFGNERSYAGATMGYEVWIAGAHASRLLVWAHEFLHAIYGLKGTTPGNHDPLFGECGL